ncbi:alpha-amylase family glycosyl hydrolase [Paenibacillus tarimensis]
MRKIVLKRLLVLVLAMALFASGCAEAGDQRRLKEQGPSNVFYEVFVRAFADSDGDGIGDLNGLISKLDYLNDGDPETASDLGVSGIWLMPVNPSPSYHGYDVTDYYAINPEYGTLEDFRRLTEEAHKRGIQVIIDLVINHTSAQHPWFIDAAANPSGDYRDWFIWKNGDAPNTSATGGQAWHLRGGDAYLGVFWGGMPDLNFDNARVRDEMIRVGKFWLEQGVDGFRLDAAKHIFEDLEGDDKKPELAALNLDWWKAFREGLQSVKPDVYLVGEVWDDSASRVAPYFTVFDSAFNFAAGQLMMSAAARETNSNLAFSLERMLGAYERLSGGKVVDAPFLTNHDQNRVMSGLRGDVGAAKMAAAMLLTLPGRPFIYYGEEIGLQGVKPDEELREPMKWVGEGAESPVQTSWRIPRHQADTPSVAEQDSDPDSLLNHYRKLIRWRSSLKVLVDGAIVPADMEPSRLMAYERRDDSERVLVVHNLGAAEAAVPLKPLNDGSSVTKVLLATREGYALEDGQLTVPGHTTLVLE